MYLCMGQQGDNDLLHLSHSVTLKPPLRLLLSHYYYGRHDLDALMARFKIPLDMFADSGAYSAFSLGDPPIDPDVYIAWVKRWKHLFSAAAGPDVIGDAESSMRDTLRMREELPDLPVLPVFHVGEDFSRLEAILRLPKMDYMALGGMVPYTKRLAVLKPWLDRCFAIIPPAVRVHGFGMTSMPILRAYPWYSVDSSSWAAAFKFAHVILFDRKKGKLVSIDRTDFKSVLSNTPLLAEYGMRPEQIKRSRCDREIVVVSLVASWRRLEEWITERHHRQFHVHLVTAPGNASPESISNGLNAVGRLQGKA